MSYIGSTPTTQSFIAGTDYFNGTGAQINFTLSRSVNSVNDIEVIVNNVEQIPSGYSVSGTTLTFSAAPSAGTSNVYVRYLSTTNLSLAIPAGTSASFNTVTATNLTSTNGASIQGLTVGRGAGAVATNTAVGASALAANTSGANSVAVGNDALKSQTTGGSNSVVGQAAMFTNTTGYYNVAIGNSAMYYNTTGYQNVALGVNALVNNTTASNNTAVGYQAGYANTTGDANVYIGRSAGAAGTTARLNTYVGDEAGGLVTTGSQNAFFGNDSGYSITTGSKNTIIGSYSGFQSGGLDIRTSTGYIVLSDGDGNPRQVIDGNGTMMVGKTASNIPTVGAEIRPSGLIASTQSGSTSATSTFEVYSTGASAYRFFVGMNGTVYATNTTISSLSDQRLKENIRDLNVGLAEVMQLQPRVFDWKEGKGKDTQNDRGFIAQEFEAVFPDLIDEWRDPAPEGEEPYKSVRQDLMPVLVKAIQEQQTLITALTARITALEAK